MYDKYHEAEFARFNLGIYLPQLYGEQSELIVPVLCANYDQKRWTGWEWVHIYGLLTKADGHRVMPSRFDYANADGLSSAAGFIELDDKSPAEFAGLILQRLAINEGHPKDHYTVDSVGSNQPSQTNPTQDTDASPGSTDNSDELHKKLAFDLLEESQLYLTQLKALMTAYADAKEIIDHFSTCRLEAVPNLFDYVRKALNKVRFDGLNESGKHKVLEAVTALYMLAALRLVDATASRAGNHVVFVPRNEQIFCAIIATALFGGALKIIPDYESQLPKPEYVFEVYASAAGDYVTASFERAMYAAIYQNNRKIDLSTLDSEELNEQETSDLEERLHSIRAIDDQNLCLVVTAGISADRAVPVSDKFKVPTLFKSNGVSKVLLGMTHENLISKIEEFWRQIDMIRKQQQTTKVTTGEQAMPNVQNNFYGQVGSLAQAHGDNSIAQAGSGQSATVNQQAGIQLAELTKLLTIQIPEEIIVHPSEKSRNKLQSHLQTAQAELAKAKPDKNLIEKSLTSIKEVGDAIEGGEKIVELCSKALPLLSVLSSVF